MIWKYIIRDLNGAIQYLPYGVMAGAVMGLILNAMNARREEGKRSLSDGRSHGVFFVPHDHTGDHFFSPERMAAGTVPWIWSFSPPGGSIREITPSWWKTCCFSSRMALHALGISLA